MDESTDKPTLIRVAEHFRRHDVEFIVIGGQAAALLGSPLPTFDVDLCYRRTSKNLRSLAAALVELHPTLRGDPPDCHSASTPRVWRSDRTSLSIPISGRSTTCDV